MRWPVVARVVTALGLLAVVAAGVGAGRPTEVRHAGPLQQVVLDLVAVATVLALPVSVVLLVIAFAGRLSKARQPVRASRWVRVVLLLMLLFALGGRAGLLRAAGRLPGVAGRPPGARGGPAADARRPDASSRQPQWPVVFLVSGLAVAGLVAVVVVARRRSPAAVLTEDEDEDEDDLLPRVRASSLAALDDEADPRRAVIAAYRAMEALLGAHRLPRHPSQTPFEYVERVLVDLGAAAEPARALAGLFAVARYSAADVTASDRDEARAALVAIGERVEASA